MMSIESTGSLLNTSLAAVNFWTAARNSNVGQYIRFKGFTELYTSFVTLSASTVVGLIDGNSLS